ncbi:MAG: carbohydrate porin, partial [Sphingomonas sp.]|nr:carbohydrate porin [Sphingomonas sp.]
MRIYLLALIAGVATPAMAQTAPAAVSGNDPSTSSQSDVFAIHGQFTLTA